MENLGISAVLRKMGLLRSQSGVMDFPAFYALVSSSCGYVASASFEAALDELLQPKMGAGAPAEDE